MRQVFCNKTIKNRFLHLFSFTQITKNQKNRSTDIEPRFLPVNMSSNLSPRRTFTFFQMNRASFPSNLNNY